MSSRRVAKFSLALAVTMLVVSVAGFIITLVLNAFFLDEYDAYGEVQIPGSGSVHLPAGEVTASLHTLVIGGTNGGGVPVPPLGVTIIPPDGVAQPVVTESIGSTTTVNNDAHVRVWVIRVPAEGTYTVTTDGQVNGYINPRLAFGHQSSYDYLVWVFIGLFVVALVDLAVSVKWLGRTRRTAMSAVVAGHPEFPVTQVTTPPPSSPPGKPQEPSDAAVRLERLKTLAALRDSGALSEEEYRTEERRILDEG
jgi:hypothetical protein